MSNGVIIDVREKDEFAIEHIENSINVPLSMFSSMAPGILNQLKEKKIVLVCRSGPRANQAKAMALNLGFNDAHNYEIYEGGIIKWRQEGKSLVSGKTASALPLARQVQLTVGVGVVIFSLLAVFVNPLFVWGAAFFGAGLTMAGVTGFCPLANLIAQMPWNKPKTLPT